MRLQKSCMDVMLINPTKSAVLGSMDVLSCMSCVASGYPIPIVSNHSFFQGR